MCRSVLLALAPLLAAAAGWAATDAPAPDWGERWQPKLPARERHPSLFFDEGDRERLRARIEQPPYSAWWEQIRKRAARSSPAFVWWLTGDEAAARQARDDLLQQPIWRQQPQGYLEPSSHRFADYVAAYDCLASWPGLAPADAAAMRRRIADEADHYYTALENVAGGRNYGNQRTLAASALGLAALALCEHTGSEHTPAEWLARALHEIRRDENWWFWRPGGLYVEGLGYTTYMNVQFVPFAIAYERASGRYLLDDPRLREWLAFAAYQVQANGEAIPWGTCESQSGLSYAVLLANRRYGGEQAALFHHVANAPGDIRVHPYHLPIAIAHYDPEAKGPLPSPSRAFPGSETAVLRGGWGADSVGVWFAGKDGTWPLAHRYGTYSHADVGHFALVAWNEVLAGDSGYDHWHSRDYYAAEFHNVPLIDGKGPEQETPGALSGAVTEGNVQRATVSASFEGVAWRRTLALVRGRYVVVADAFQSDQEHEYAWQVRSTCPPDAPGTRLEGRAVTWPGLSAAGWRTLTPGETELTVVAPPFADLRLQAGRWRPISSKPEFRNQVAIARWRAASSTALFVLIPNRKDAPDVSWQAEEGNGVKITGPGWTDHVDLVGGRLKLRSDAGDVGT